MKTGEERGNCGSCGGTGEKSGKPCNACGGTGWKDGQQPVDREPGGGGQRTVKFSRWNTVEFLNSYEMIIEYLAGAIEEDDPADPMAHQMLVKYVENAVGALRRLRANEQDSAAQC